METFCTTIKPENFQPKFIGSFCVIEAESGEVLFLHRQDWKPEGNTWGIPGGKIQEGESDEEAVNREVIEETGWKLDEIKLLDTFYVRYPGYDFIFHMWHQKVAGPFDAKINPKEHKDFCWMKPVEAMRKLPLIGGLDKCFESVYLKN